MVYPQAALKKIEKKARGLASGSPVMRLVRGGCPEQEVESYNLTDLQSIQISLHPFTGCVISDYRTAASVYVAAPHLLFHSDRGFDWREVGRGQVVAQATRWKCW